MSRPACLVALVGLALALATCSTNPTAPSVEGRPVIELEGDARWGFWWSPATGELLTMAGGASDALIAIDPETGATRTIDPIGDDYRLAVSADGSALFYNRNEADSNRAILASLAPPGAGRSLAACPRTTAFVFAGQAPAGLAAYGVLNGDSVTLHDLGTDERRRIAEGIPILFSPDGSKLAHYATATGLRILSGDISTPAGLPRPPLYDFDYPLAGPRLRWDARGLRMLYVSEDHTQLMYVEPSGSPRPIATIGRRDPYLFIDRTSLVWSPSGRTAAVWCHRSGEGSGFWHDLYFIHVDIRLHGLGSVIPARRVTTAQGFTNGFVNGRLAISPDDTRLYADVGRTLYEFPVGPTP